MLTEEQKFKLYDLCDEGKWEELEVNIQKLCSHKVIDKKELRSMLFTDSEGNERTLLHIACDKGHTDEVKMLLRHKFSPHTKDSEGNTALHIACYADSEIKIEIVQLLLKAAESSRGLINTENNYNDFALGNALYINTPQVGNQVVKLLLEERADPNSGDEWRTPLWKCIVRKRSTDQNEKNFDTLLKAGADYLHSDGVIGNAMHRIASIGHIKLAELLYSKAKADHHVVELFKRSPAPYNKSVIEIAKNNDVKELARNNDVRENEFVEWYKDKLPYIRHDIQEELGINLVGEPAAES